MLKELKSAVLIYLVLTVLTGVFYPACIDSIAQTFFGEKATGSITYRDGKTIGSTLIGQSFDNPKYFWGRLSATSPNPYNAASSSGSNLGPANLALKDRAAARIKALREADPSNLKPVPVDLVTASASGLDPHISVAAATYQISRISHVRNIPENKAKQIVDLNVEGRWLGIFGEPVVNVLKLNLFLDRWEQNPAMSLDKSDQGFLADSSQWGHCGNPRSLNMQ